jgi:hypothetical protein
LDTLRGRSSLAHRLLIAFSNCTTVAVVTIPETNTGSSSTLPDFLSLLFKLMFEAIAQHRVFCTRGDEALRS